VGQGDDEQVREATGDAFKQVAEEAGLPPTVLDDLLWERGREDPDLIGDEAGELNEPPRREGVVFY
jgi:N-glycosylase/DNA lyase